MVGFTSRYSIEIRQPTAFFAVFSRPVSTAYEQVPELPADFARHWSPARHPSQWETEPSMFEHPPNSRLQRRALSAAAEPPAR